MALMLVHATLDGTPIGVWNEALESFYSPGFEGLQNRAKAMLQTKGTAVPWDVYVDRMEQRTSFVDWWKTVDTEASLEDALSSEIGRYRALSEDEIAP